ncbi:SRPBCC family protein [Streptomyces otsuchiensis]|uniref:SRPBCC family protein n=1 Tax=Streptomyces otsuchiensis TaxID=2681388 RepID=UPI0010312441|nr:SRPBCC domain-containing protein [Streptomyces otsuchiensis]
MNRYDLIDEVVIGAPADTVWDALIAELSGGARWWVPHNTFAVTRATPDVVGGEVAITVHTKGVDNGGPKLRFTARTTAVEPGRRLDVEYVRGAFSGPTSFVLTPVDDGRATRLSMHFQGRPQGVLRLLARVVDVGAQHSAGTLAAFRALDALIAAGRPVHDRAEPAAQGGDLLDGAVR